ncbi:hypothetical protein JCM3766R1_003460 [Sporobolomyces carnicolor]
MYPTSKPVALPDFPTHDAMQLDDEFSPACTSSIKYVQYLAAAAEASRLYPPEPEPPRPFAQLPRFGQRFDQLDGSAARRLPQSKSQSKGRGAVQLLRGEKCLAKKYKPEWKDVPYANNFSIESEFLSLPPPVLDLILSSDSLTLRDHLALAATCRPLRACYFSSPSPSAPLAPLYSSLWRALVALRPPVEHGRSNVRKLTAPEIENLIYQIWSIGTQQVDTDAIQFIRSSEESDDDDEGGGGAAARPRANKTSLVGVEPIRSKEWDNAIDLVHTIRISKSEAKKLYKLSEKDLNNYLASFVVKSKGGSTTRALYLESAVEALALRLHGGVGGHAQHVARLAETARKAKNTRAHNQGM